MTIEQLRARLAELQAQMDAIVQAAERDNSGNLSEEQLQQFDAARDEFDSVQARIERMEAIDSRQQWLNASAGRRVPPAPIADPTPRVTAVDPEPDPTGGFQDFGEFALAVREAGVPSGSEDNRLTMLRSAAPASYGSEGTGADGGYGVPPAMRAQVFDLAFDESSVLSLVDSEPVGGNSTTILSDETTPWGSTGVQAYWRAEGAQMTPSKMAEQEQNVRLHELYALVPVTDELLADRPRLTNRLTVKSAQAIRWKSNDAILNGDGVGKPLGIINSGGYVSVAKKTSQTADTLVPHNIGSMFSRLYQGPGARIAWMGHPTILPSLMEMSIGNQPAWVPSSNGLVGGINGTLLGYPIEFSHHLPGVLGDQWDLILGNWAGYFLARKAAMQAAQSAHLWFDYGMTAFRWTFRLNGQPHLSTPIQPPNSAPTIAHFVTLDART